MASFTTTGPEVIMLKTKTMIQGWLCRWSCVWNLVSYIVYKCENYKDYMHLINVKAERAIN
jgi:hypothetical protein